MYNMSSFKAKSLWIRASHDPVFVLLESRPKYIINGVPSKSDLRDWNRFL